MEKHIPPVLETERLILRPLDMGDKAAIFAWASDPQVAKFMRYSTYTSPDDATFWLEHIYDNDKALDYGFVWKETGELIGSGGMVYNSETDDWTIGYNLRRDMWGKGLSVEASKKIIEYARANYEVKRIEGVFAVDNPNSGKVMTKLGMSYHSDCEYTSIDGTKTFKAKKYEIKFE